MIVTDRFVYLAFPRTATTFVRDALKRLYGVGGGSALNRVRSVQMRKKLREYLLPMTDTTSAEIEGRNSPHGAVRQIPEEARRLRVFSTMRNPYDLVVSAYEHRFWRNHPICDVEVLHRKYPEYSELSFAQYVAMTHDEGVRDLLKGASVRTDIGPVTLRFLKFFSPEPDGLIASITDEFLEHGDVAGQLADVHFVHTERLVPGLREFLGSVGFAEKRTRFLLDLPRANIAEARQGRAWQDYYTPELRTRVRRAERLLFRLFPQYDC